MKKMVVFMPRPAPIEERLDIFGDMAIHWRCSMCKQWLPLHTNFFQKNKTKKSGFSNRCKDCLNEQETNRLKQENKKIWFAKKASLAQSRAKKKGFDFDLKFDDLEYPVFCPMTNYKLSYAIRTKHTDNSQRAEAASLDRIDSSEGYVAGNVRVVSWLYNRMKGPHSDAFLYKTCKIFVDNNPHLDIM